MIISAQREGRRLIAVVLGGASGTSRNEHMTDLVERSFKVMGIAPVKSLSSVSVAKEPLPKRKYPQMAVNSSVKLRGRDKQTILVSPDKPPLKLANNRHANNWGIQIGAFLNRNEAQAQIDAVAGVTGIKNGHIRPLTRNGQTLYRARYEKLSITKAQAACKALANLSTGCLIVATN